MKAYKFLRDYAIFVIPELIIAVAGNVIVAFTDAPILLKVIMVWSIFSFPTWCWFQVSAKTSTDPLRWPLILRYLLIVWMIPGIALFVLLCLVATILSVLLASGDFFRTRLCS